MAASSNPEAPDALLVEASRSRRQPPPVRLASSPLLAALQRAGTSHVYADTADTDEVRTSLMSESGDLALEVDGSTANQPLVQKVIDRYLDQVEIATYAQALRDLGADLARPEPTALLYAIVCARIGNDLVRAFGGGRTFEVSIQVHMGLMEDAEREKRIGRALHRMAPSAFVKIPFAPHAPQGLLVARDLEAEGVPVNLTSTFSARQVVVGALLANVTRTNIFMGRLNQGLHAQLLGEHVDLAAQRALTGLRRRHGLKTQLIVASVREWQSLVRVAGCDVFTAPCEVLREFLARTDLTSADIQSQLETSYADRLGVAAEVTGALGRDRIARLYRVEPELIEFLLELRASDEFRRMRDGDQLVARFQRAGFTDLFHAPSAAEANELRKSKLPDPGAPLTQQIALDTLFTLLANADFGKSQETIDRKIAERLARNQASKDTRSNDHSKDGGER
jgi:transaldolase